MADVSLLEEKLGFALENHFHNVGYHKQCSKKHKLWIKGESPCVTVGAPK